MRLLIRFFRTVLSTDRVLKALLFSTASGIGLLFVRTIISRNLTYTFLVWNLFLASIPLFISRIIVSAAIFQRSRTIIIASFFTWLIFFPNAPNILTDFIHLHQRESAPLWLDLILIAIFAWNGLIIGFLSLHDMHRLVTIKNSSRTGWVFAFAVLVAGSFGVYTGRYLRYNSWDIILYTENISSDLTEILLRPGQNLSAYGMTLGLAVFLITSYYTFTMLLDKVNVSPP